MQGTGSFFLAWKSKVHQIPGQFKAQEPRLAESWGEGTAAVPGGCCQAPAAQAWIFGVLNCEGKRVSVSQEQLVFAKLR